MTERSECEQLLRDIRSTLEEIRSILILSNQDRLEDMRNPLLPQGSVKKRIYDLCDGSTTTQQMAVSLSKETKYVSSYITILRRQGLVKTVEKDGEQVHEQVF